MADIAWSDVTATFPADAALVGVSLLVQDMLLERVNNELDPNVFGGVDTAKFKLARIYLVAHMAAFGVLGTEGPVIAEGVDDLNKQYAASFLPGAYGLTAYGVLFEQLLKSSPRRIGICT